MPSNNKVLVVACGGTGTRIARALADKFDRLPSHVTIAVIDAHTGRPEGGRIQGAEFSGSERIAYPQEWSRLNGIDNSGLRSWWPNRVQAEKEVGFHDGCGALRSNGRFYMLRHSEHVVRAIDRAINKLTSASGIGMDGQAGEEIHWEVYVLASLGNGTGGGTFMDVAAIVKHRLAEQGFIRPKVVGVFVPGSVTRKGSSGIDQDWMENQVAASGFAALVELQYEFNRQKPTDSWRPGKPYSFTGFSGGTYVTWRPAWGIPNEGDASREPPYDFALILDAVNKRSVRNEYHDLIDAGAEALKMLLTGANEANRLLDLERKCKEGRRFGSVGSMALEAPTAELVQYAARRATLSAFDRGGDESLDPAVLGDLLGDMTPHGAARYASAGSDVAGSVDFFLSEVLRVKETQGPDGAGHNQLFELFEAEDEELRRSYNEAQGGDGGLQVTPRGQVIGKAKSLRDWIVIQAEDLRKAREETLVVGPSSRFHRVPASSDYDQLEDLDEAGIGWLLEQRAARFVQRGAFGAMVAWFEELKRQLDANVASVYQHEVVTYLGGESRLASGTAGLDLDRLITDLDDATGSIFSIFMGSAIAQKAAAVDDALANRLEFDLWHSKIEAVLALYKALDQHVAVLTTAARAAASELRGKGVRAELQHTADLIADRLSNRRRGAKVAYIGCDTDVRDDLVASLEDDETTASVGLLGLVPDLMWRLFAWGLGRDRGAVRLLAAQLEGRTESLPLDRLRLLVEEGTLSAVQERVSPVVARLANVDQLLLREARTVLVRYHADYYLPVLKQRRPAGEPARQALDAVAGVVGEDIARIDDFFARFPELDEALYHERRDGGADGAVMVFVRGRVRNLIAAALPLWRPVLPHDLRSLVQETAFFNHNDHARHVSQALRDLKTGDAGGLDVAAQESPFFHPSRIECVFIALGGELSWLARESEVQSYRLAMDGMPDLPKDEPYRTWFAGFNPHSSREYEEAGLAWLERWDQHQTVGTTLGDLGGEMLLALAQLEVATHPQLFRWISRRGAHFYLDRHVDQRYEDGSGKPVFSDAAVGMAPGSKIGPKGIQHVTDWLEGYDRSGADGTDGKALAGALKTLLWDDLETWITGDSLVDPAVPGAGLKTVVAELGRKASALRSEGSDSSGGRSDADTRARMGQALQKLADELMASKGARPAFLQT